MYLKENIKKLENEKKNIYNEELGKIQIEN